MVLTNTLNSIVNIVAIVLCVAFIAGYFGYGNRLQRPAGRAFMIMAFGCLDLLIPLLLHHPFGLSTSVVSWVAWVQIAGVSFFSAGMAYLISIGVRVNGKWPWEQ
jgi:drug/metabolite transporter (DMT)-like permease